MNTTSTLKSKILIPLTLFFITFSLSAQVGGWNPELEADAKKEFKKMVKDSPKLKTFKNKAYGYAIFPKITKAGLGIGGAAGKGVVYKGGKPIGEAKLIQASFGLQAGGQQYSEVIFFENKEALDHFTNGHLKFDGQASAVAISKGVSADIAYKDGVAVFTRAQGGLMAEASLGGQHFKYEPKN